MIKYFTGGFPKGSHMLHRPHSYSIAYTTHSHMRRYPSITKIEVEVNMHYCHVAPRWSNGEPQLRWNSRTYYPTPASLARLLKYSHEQPCETYCNADDEWRMTHELTYSREGQGGSNG